MKIKNILPVLLAIFGAFIFLASCEEELGTLGSEIIGDQNVNTTLDNSKSVVTYSRKMSPVQSNGLPIYQLGTYNDPVYGQTTANLLTQITLATPNPNFNNVVVMDSVVLYMPYFNEATTDDDGVLTYELDSVYGGDPINISIFESGYFLRDFDPETDFEEAQNYFINQGDLFTSFQGELIHEIPNFVSSNQGFTTIEVPPLDDAGVQPDSVTTTLGPGIRVMLSTQIFKEKFVDMEGTPELLNNNNFRNYFRGLYFKVTGGDDNLIKFDLANAKIDMFYTSQIEPLAASGELSDSRLRGLLSFNFNAININTIDTEYPGTIEANLMNPNIEDGEDRLHLKGGDGIITIIDLFGADTDGNGVADELDQMRTEKWLINEANLIFYVDKDAVTGGSKEPERLLVYDVENNSALIDYAEDTTASAEPIDSYTTHLGRLERGSDGFGDFYKIRITNHLSNLIHRDSTNVTLGLVVSQNVGDPFFQDLESIIAPGVEQIPSSAVISHEGTVLYGNAAVNEERKLKLQIYYTESN